MKGQISVTLLFFAGLTVVLVSGFVFLASSFLQLSVRSLNKARVFSVAEAGIEYYRWHLAHAPQDFQDGTGQEGPYIHNYYDKDGALIGTFSLVITPPPPGSTVVTIRSSGFSVADPSIVKTIEVKMAIPSLAKYAWALNDNVSFGSTAEVFGQIQSNAGIHFNGVAHNLVASALTTYTNPDTGQNQWAVYTTKTPADPQPPTALPGRPDVFMAGRSVGVPAVDFTKLTQDLSSVKSLAQASGTYFPSSTVSGYDLALATSGIYTLYKVTALVPAPSGCNDTGQSGWGTWSIQTETVFSTGTIPMNGNLFFEDNLWVRGKISNKRATIASGRFPDNAATRSSITVNNSVTYTNYNASDTIAFLAQNNFNVGLASDDNLRIDGALVAMNGRIGRYSYPNSQCGSTRTRALLTTDGMLVSALRPAFLYSSSNGYQSRSYNYDSNLLYAPPPSFPLTTDQYSIISWNEIQ